MEQAAEDCFGSLFAASGAGISCLACHREAALRGSMAVHVPDWWKQ
jgi:hypothetical protein